MAAIISFLSDYGHEDEFVGVCHGVIARICPQARVIDITHGVPRHAIRRGALLLRGALPYLPAGVHLAVVDPGVGSARRGVAVRLADGRLLVGPDNGLLSLAIEVGGGAVEAVEIGSSPWRLEPAAATFHGRDVFAPVAAHLAAGEPLADGGAPFDVGTLSRLELPIPWREGDMLIAHVLTVDRFGNVILDAGHEELADDGPRLGEEVGIEIRGALHRARFARTFEDVAAGELIAYEDAARSLALAVNRGSARERLAVAIDDEIRLRPL